jgi:glycosidase
MAKWWERAVFYQIYPRSFMDSGGDGVGDLPGIESKLDYLAALGVDALWISPFYPSPMADFGYDIADYCGVDPLFGDLAAFDRLLAHAHGKGIRVIIDLVINHTSEEHPWFVEARSSRTAPKHDWYIWKPIRRGILGRYVRPNNWVAQFELASAWWPNEATGEYYLGTFTRNQPEVDWRNGELRQAMYAAIRFWLDRGVDGFRMDVVNWYVKDSEFRSNPRNLVANPDLFQRHVYDRDRPETHDVCREIRAIADSYPGDRVLVGEIFCRDPAQAASYHGAKLDELHMAFNFDLLYRRWSARAFRESIKRWYAALPAGAWPNMTFSNHDQPRHIWRFRTRSAAETEARARVAAALLLTLRGTPFVYYGEELGMTQAKLAREELRDPLGVKTWPLALGRDGERTPMQWSSAPSAGFTSGLPWLPVNPDYIGRNVAAEEADPMSLLSWYRQLIALRKGSAALTSGDIEFLDGDDGAILSYVRTFNGERVVVALNLTSRFRPIPAAAAKALRGGAPLLASGNTARAAGSPPATAGSLAPYEVLVVRG